MWGAGDLGPLFLNPPPPTIPGLESPPPPSPAEQISGRHAQIGGGVNPCSRFPFSANQMQYLGATPTVSVHCGEMCPGARSGGLERGVGGTSLSPPTLPLCPGAEGGTGLAPAAPWALHLTPHPPDPLTPCLPAPLYEGGIGCPPPPPHTDVGVGLGLCRGWAGVAGPTSNCPRWIDGLW